MNDSSSNKQQSVSYLSILLKLLLVILLSTISTGLVMKVRQHGWLQISELKSFDLIMKLKGSWMELTGTSETPDSRILIVTIDDRDIQYLHSQPIDRTGAVSLPDETFTKLLDKLDQVNKQKSLIIGLDIYHKGKFEVSLAERLKNDYRFFVVCKAPSTDGVGIPPPGNIPQKSLGFSDVIVDEDGIVRRHLLRMSLSNPPCRTGNSFNFLIASKYLYDKNVNITLTKENELQFKGIILKKLTARSSGYQGVDAGGYQIMLNYRYRCLTGGDCNLKNFAESIPLRHVLENGINHHIASQLEDEDSLIILIGVTAINTPGITPDIHNTPYGEEIPGVFLQAQMISQILSTVRDGRPLIGWWSIRSEKLWVLGWSFLGAILGVWIINRPRNLTEISWTIGWLAAPVKAEFKFKAVRFILFRPLNFNNVLSMLDRQLQYLVVAVPVVIGVQFTTSFVIFVKCSKWIPLVPAVLATVFPLALPKTIKSLPHIPLSRWLEAALVLLSTLPLVGPAIEVLKTLFKKDD